MSAIIRARVGSVERVASASVCRLADLDRSLELEVVFSRRAVTSSEVQTIIAKSFCHMLSLLC